MVITYREKIINLWAVFLLGTLFHTQLGLMPLFHSLNVVESQPAKSLDEVSLIFWLMLGFFMLPMLAIIGTTFTENKRYRILHFGLSVFYGFMNLMHLVLDLLLPRVIWYQIALMAFLFLLGLLLIFVAYRWMKYPVNRQN
ncbi:hypothetical protein WJM97_03100 [Okeanomitos corallinicola TIOX110]|uniref:Uncharacterized protein n=1 Tax=Okeanomitos corallinicola TIOX110 TaxID=3133117 RepID=A0ABZ2UZ55_9CYAN